MTTAPTFTVFTPTFNRADKLIRPYGSLLRQTTNDFEWLVIDDGSTDHTSDLIAKWQREAPFPIRYLVQANQGKHVAFNRAVREARGILFLSLDSDDACVPNALETLKQHWEDIPASQRGSYCGVTALCIDQTGILVGSLFPADVFDSNSMEIVYKYRIRGEKWGFQRTDILRLFPFPEPPGEKFVPEGIVWSQIARVYKTRYVNDRLRIYHLDPERDQRISTTSEPSRHALGLALWHHAKLTYELQWFFYSPVMFLTSAFHYIRFSFHTSVPLPTQMRRLPPAARWLCLAVLPMAFLQYVLDRILPQARS